MSLPKKNWTIHTKRADFDALSLSLGIDKVIARIMVNRNIKEQDMPSFLCPSKNNFNNPHNLMDMDKAVEIIKEHVNGKKRLRIIGDYDIDGICATYILMEALKNIGAKVDFYLPKRIEDGYGINKKIVQKAIKDGIDLIITVDNGISACDAIAYAKKEGINVIITDHHEVPKDSEGSDDVPCADAVINPKRSDCQYAYKEICGAVVAWKLATCLYEAYDFNELKPLEYLEFCAFATVGDIMKLHDENRAIVSLGLKKMAHTKNTGLSALIERCGLNGKNISAYHVGFVLGPCLNAGGRLADASMGISLFKETDRQKALEIAEALIDLNEERKNMTHMGTQSAIDKISGSGYEDDKVIVVYVPNIHESLCGIIAGRLREKYSRPCFMLTDGENCVKGSGRSIPAFSMFEKLSEIKELFMMFGGHPMAAGLSINMDNIGVFRKQINNNCCLTNEDLIEKVMIDVAMPLGYISMDLVKQLDLLEPFGNGNEKPVFARKGVCVWKMQRIGKNGEYLKLMLKDEETYMDALYFSDADEFCGMVESGDYIDILYYPQINEYRGEESLQVVVSDYRLTG